MDRLGLIDILVLVAYLASAILVGLVLSGKSKSLEAYLLGDRNLPWWAILGSIVATETSAATVLSVPGEGYGPTGMKFLQLALGYIVGRAAIVHFLLPLYFRGELQTAYEVLHVRFGGAMRQAASLLFLVARNVGDGLRLLLAAVVLEKLLGLSDEWQWMGMDAFVLSALVMGVVSTIYTFVGGMRSVIWNDCIQFAVYVLGGVLAMVVIAYNVSGGFGQIWQFAIEHDKLRMIALAPPEGDPRPWWVWLLAEPYTLWAGVIGGAVLTLGTHGTDHSMVQRYLSARSQADASRALLASGVVVFVQFAMFLFIGVSLACYFDQHSASGLKKDEVFAHFIVNEFPRNTGLIGLMLAAILASNLSSSLSASAAAVVHDFYLPACRRTTDPERLLWLTRWLTVVFGTVQIAIGIGARSLYERDTTVVTSALTVAGFAFGLLLGVFALGVFTRRAGQWDALVGAVAGFGLLVYLQFLSPASLKVAFPWFALIGAGTTFVVGFLASYVHPAHGAKT
ncbi:MAG: sodium:solute symporter [Planctomycetaceae bacterium]|nr:sodium:solute symporter [Planctomycetaceae bacterium]